MDRLSRSFVACGLGLMLAAAGCRATRPEVPPGRPFTKEGQQRPAIQFSSDAPPVSGAATTNFMPNNVGGSNLGAGIGSGGTRPDGAAFGGPQGAYGGPGTSGLAQPPNLNDPSTGRGSSAPSTMMPPPGMPPIDSSPAPDLNVTPSRGPMTNPITPGSMGSSDQPPSPN